MNRIFRICLLAPGVLMTMLVTHALAQSLPHSFARPDEAAIKHLHLDLKADFGTKRLTGSAELTIVRKPGVNRLYLDTDDLEVFGVTTVDGGELKWQLGEPQLKPGEPRSKPGESQLKPGEPQLKPGESQLKPGEPRSKPGRPLLIEMPEGVERVVINYATRPSSQAVQWLSPGQTTDKRQPFLFTQSQAILARTWVPCQDTPAVRMTYSARIQVPPQLMAVMSASNPQSRNDTGVYEFEMRQPIPSYLLALAVGDIEFRSLGPRSGVYAEPSVLKKAVWELHDTERMISAAEELYGPYRWERYDVIILPSSFPFGGMENPRLTFATPTILAGDRSLVALIAHELAHSWSGNLVTNATWNDFWLNEGFTVYFEQRIMESLYGRDYAEMLASLTLDGLREEIRELEVRDTWLKLDLAGRNPDDGMTAIAYDKGYFFLRMLEEKVGRETWDDFLRTYFNQFAFQSMTTETFLQYLKDNLDAEVDVQAWVYAPGLPENCPRVETGELAQVEAEVAAFRAGRPAESLDTADWTTHHWLHFLRSFEDGLSTAQMKQLDAAFRFSESGNSEITHDWLLHVIQSDYEPGMKKLEQFLVGQGRRKFLQPLYAKLMQSEKGKQIARRIYARARPGYHAVSRQTIDQLTGFER